SQNKHLTKHISFQCGQRVRVETLTCSHGIPSWASPGEAMISKSSPSGPGMRNDPKSSPVFDPHGPLWKRYRSSCESIFIFCLSHSCLPPVVWFQASFRMYSITLVN